MDPDRNEESKGLLDGLNYKGGNLLASRVFGMSLLMTTSITLLVHSAQQQEITAQNGILIF